MARSTIFNGNIHYFDWAIFNSYVSHYQRVMDGNGVFFLNYGDFTSISWVSWDPTALAPLELHWNCTGTAPRVGLVQVYVGKKKSRYHSSPFPHQSQECQRNVGWSKQNRPDYQSCSLLDNLICSRFIGYFAMFVGGIPATCGLATEKFKIYCHIQYRTAIFESYSSGKLWAME